MNDVEVVILKNNQWIRVKLTAFKWEYTNEGLKFQIEGYEDVEEPIE